MSTCKKVYIPNIKFNNGIDIPALGCGTWLGVDEHGKLNIKDTPKLIDALSYAIDIGYRHIDTAHLYRVEPEVGMVVTRKINEGVVKREELFITTKVWNHNHRPADVEASVRASLRRLDTYYIDLLLMHYPISVSEDGIDEKIDYLDTWKGFEAVQKQGLVKSIGVSNFNVQQLERLLANSTTVPVVNQVEINLNLSQKELVEFCQKNDIVVTAFTPFGCMVSGRWGCEDKPEPKHDNPIVVGIARKHGKTVPQIALRYLYQRGIGCIPKTLNMSRLEENAAIFDYELDRSDVASLETFDVGYRTIRPVWWQNFQNYPFEKIDVEIPDVPLLLRKWQNGANEDID